MNLSLTHIWIIVAALALIIELVSVSLVFVFFTIGALVTALLSWLGVVDSLNLQLLCFSIVSVLALLGLRKPLKNWVKRNKNGTEYSEYSGDRATVINAIPARGEGRVFYRGTEWIALSDSGHEIENGKSVVIKALDGIKLIVTEE
jgi:membrane protein implicated in regulation of membrane protease activity